MKKMAMLLGASLILAGCGDKEPKQEDPAVSDSSIVSEATDSSSAAKSTNSSEASSKAESSDATASSGVKVGEDLTFVPQAAEVEQGYTVDSDPLLQSIQDRIEKSDSLGIENDVAIHFTGLYLGEKGKSNVQAAFIIVNRTNVAMTDIDLNVSMATKDGQEILNQAKYHLSEDDFGVLEPNTIMPIYLSVPAENEETFFSIEDMESVTYSIDHFDYKEK